MLIGYEYYGVKTMQNNDIGIIGNVVYPLRVEPVLTIYAARVYGIVRKLCNCFKGGQVERSFAA